MSDCQIWDQNPTRALLTIRLQSSFELSDSSLTPSRSRKDIFKAAKPSSSALISPFQVLPPSESVPRHTRRPSSSALSTSTWRGHGMGPGGLRRELSVDVQVRVTVVNGAVCTRMSRRCHDLDRQQRLSKSEQIHLGAGTAARAQRSLRSPNPKD